MSQPQLGVSFEPGPPPRVSRVEPDHALAHAGIVIGDALVAVDGTDVSAMELGSVLPLLVSRPIELTFSRDFLPAAVRAESSRLPEPEGDSNFATAQPQEVA
jgi:membrane-associated protease RseP (regulator of RpoE activity)